MLTDIFTRYHRNLIPTLLAQIGRSLYLLVGSQNLKPCFVSMPTNLFVNGIILPGLMDLVESLIGTFCVVSRPGLEGSRVILLFNDV